MGMGMGMGGCSTSFHPSPFSLCGAYQMGVAGSPSGLTVPGCGEIVWLPAVSWAMVAWCLATWAVAPSGEELELLVTGTIPGLDSPLALHNWSWQGRCWLGLSALPAEAQGGECTGSCHWCPKEAPPPWKVLITSGPQCWLQQPTCAAVHMVNHARLR